MRSILQWKALLAVWRFILRLPRGPSGAALASAGDRRDVAGRLAGLLFAHHFLDGFASLAWYLAECLVFFPGALALFRRQLAPGLHARVQALLLLRGELGVALCDAQEVGLLDIRQGIPGA